MPNSAVLLGILALSIGLLAVLAATLVAALYGRGPLYGRFVEFERDNRDRDRDQGRNRGWEGDRDRGLPDRFADRDLNGESHFRMLPRARATVKRDPQSSRATDIWDTELNAVLRGSYAAAAVNRAVRILAWSFILVILLIVSVGGMWESERLPIYATLIIAGVFVLLGHEIMPSPRPSTARIIVEATVALIVITILVAMTGNASSPFFFLFPVLVGGVALITAPWIAVSLTCEAAAAFALAALAGPTDGATGQDALVRVGINLAALVLLTYSGMVIARVQKQTRDTAVRLSTLDPLTDLYNRAYLFNVVEREIDRSRRYKRGFCLLMMDLDGLKAINDRYGHFQGDNVLRGVARLITAGLRSIDVASRYAGDEFVAVLPETDSSGAFVVAEKIRRTVADMIVDTGTGQIRTSLSIGVVMFPEDGQTADELMIAADEAMDSSKRLGKNKVVGYAEPGSPLSPPTSFERSEMGQSQRTSTPGFRPLPRDPEDWPAENTEGR